MTNKTALYFDERCLWHTTGEHVATMPVGNWIQPSANLGHPESPESKRRIKSLLDVSGLTAQLDQKSADKAPEEDLLRVHEQAYLKKLDGLSQVWGGMAGFSAPFGRGSYEIARLSAGLAKRAVDDVLKGQNPNAYTLSRPPGHHCLRHEGMGFCLLANIAVAIEAAIANHALHKVAVVDWDVHHGNGTQSIFYDRPDVLTISLHQENCFPQDSGAVNERGGEAGEGYNINIPLLPGSGHAAYLYTLERIVIPALESYQPELIVVASGLDGNGFDPLARMQLHSESYRAMTERLVKVANQLCGGRLAVIHEGGYSESYVPFCGLAVVEALSGYRTEVADPFLPAVSGHQPNPRFEAFQNGLIDEIAEIFLS